MGGGGSKPDPKKQQPQAPPPQAQKQQAAPNETNAIKKLENAIPVYQKPASPKLEQVRIEKLQIDQSPVNDKPKVNNSQKNAPIVADPPKQEIDINKLQIDPPDNSFDNLNLNANDIKELERQLQSDDLSPINIPQPILKRPKVVKKMNINFNFADSGQIQLVSVNFKYQYNYKFQKLAIIKSYDSYVNSILKWIKVDDVYQFKLKDVDVYDIATGDVDQLPSNEIEFTVDVNGTFVAMERKEDILRTIVKQKTEIQQQIQPKISKQQLTPAQIKQQIKQQAENIIQQTEKHLAQFWYETIQCWYDQKEKDNKTSMNFQGQKCNRVIKSTKQSREKLETFLNKKLQDTKFFKACFQSAKTIKDALKKWGMFTEDEELAYLNEPKYSIVNLQKKISYPILDKYSTIEGIVNDQLIPHLVLTDNASKTVIEHNQDLFVDIEHESKLIMLLWDSQLSQKSKVQSQSVFVEQLNIFKDQCDKKLKETIFQLSVIPNFPMENRPKFKEKYFQLS